MMIRLEKIAVFGRVAQRAVSREFTKRLIPAKQLRDIAGLGVSVSSYGALAKTFKRDLVKKQKQLRERVLEWAKKSPLAKAPQEMEGFTPKQLRLMKSMGGRTIAPTQGVMKFFEDFRSNLSRGERGAMTKKIKALSKEDARALRSVIGAHELAEVRMGARKKLKGPGFYTHVSPAVLLDESSRLSALSPKRAKVKDIMRYVRKATGEEEELREIIPGYIHGKSRFNRTQRRRLSEIVYKKKQDEVEAIRAVRENLEKQMEKMKK